MPGVISICWPRVFIVMNALPLGPFTSQLLSPTKTPGLLSTHHAFDHFRVVGEWARGHEVGEELSPGGVWGIS
jgi:hypothetical protein